MDVAQKVFACFDQNDLKAPIALSVVADPSWTVLANGVTLASADGHWEFAATPPIPPALVVVAAGPWASVRWEHAGLPFGWHARASLADELHRDADELREITERCYDHFAEIFDEPYPFDSYDQVFVPGLNWGAQEMPGCVTYRDEFLPRGTVPEHLRLLRAAVIAHEMSHMWFGDLVTMTWWEDSWLQESFADYLGYRVAADAAGFPGALLGHEAARKPGAYDADERRSTHPVAPDPEDVPDVDAAATIFDSISYAKGNSVLRQLVTWLGDEAFLRGVNTYLTRHRFANATLADFVAALDEASDRDVRSWIEVWLRTTGYDTIRVERDGDVPVLHRDGVRPHRVRVTAYDDTWAEVGSELVDLADEPVALPAYAGLVVVPNSHGETFARLALDDRSWEAVTEGLCRVDDDLVRAVLWTMLFDRVQTGALAPTAYVELLGQHLPGERSATLVTSGPRPHARQRPPAAGRRPTQVAGYLETVAAATSTGLLHATAPELALPFATGFAATSTDAETLRGWLDTDRRRRAAVVPGAAVERGARGSPRSVPSTRRTSRRSGCADPGTEAELGAATALAARPTAEAKESAWAVVSDPAVDNRGFLAVDDRPVVSRAARPGGAVRRSLPARGAGAGPPADRPSPRWSVARIPRCGSPTRSCATLDEALAGDLPTVLRRQWEDWRDDLGYA